MRATSTAIAPSCGRRLGDEHGAVVLLHQPQPFAVAARRRSEVVGRERRVQIVDLAQQLARPPASRRAGRGARGWLPAPALTPPRVPLRRRRARAGSACVIRCRPAPRSRSRSPWSAPAPAAVRHRRAASTRTIDFTSGICRGAIDRLRSPRPISTQVSIASPAMSPHIATGLARSLRRDHDLAQRRAGSPGEAGDRGSRRARPRGRRPANTG